MRRYRRGYQQVVNNIGATPTVALSANPHRRSLILSLSTTDGPVSVSFGSPQPFGVGINLTLQIPTVAVSDEDIGDMVTLDLYAVAQSGPATLTILATEDCGMEF